MTSIEGYPLRLTASERAKPEVDVAALARTYSATMFRVAHSVLRSPAEAEDVVQDAFLRVLQHRRRLQDVQDVRVWLVRITWNLALDRRRRMRPEQMDDAFAATLAARCAPADEALQEAQWMRSVLREIDLLPKKEREVLLLSALDELGAAELAAVVGRSESAVRALLFRARARLRERLQKSERGGGVR